MQSKYILFSVILFTLPAFKMVEYSHVSYGHDDIHDLPKNSDPADVESILQKEITNQFWNESFVVSQYFWYFWFVLLTGQFETGKPSVPKHKSKQVKPNYELFYRYYIDGAH